MPSDPDRQTISIYQETYDRHRQRKEDMGLTWDEYLDEQAPVYPDALIDALMERLGERIDAAARQAIQEELREIRA